MPVPYTVKRGDSVSAIARMHGLRTWQELYGHRDNSALRTRRPDPNKIYPGDVVMIPAVGLNYVVPGIVPIVRQPTSLVCWATAYSIMISWKDGVSYSIRDAVADVAPSYGVMVDNNQGLPPSQFLPFLRAAGMRHESMASLPIQEWAGLLRWYGPLWIGTLGVVSPGTYLHSRIVIGIRGNGSADGTWMIIIDPEDGSRYEEVFSDFITTYEGAFTQSQGSSTALREYYQIRHF